MRNSAFQLLFCAALSAFVVMNGGCSSGTQKPTVIGIHHQHGDYSFTREDLLNEGADRALEMGCKAIGVYMGPEYSVYYHGLDERAGNLKELAQTAAYRRFFNKPFDVISITCYSFDKGLDRWREGIETFDPDAEYKEIRELTEYLLVEYGGSGKTFILKNWEGDWQLLGSYERDAEPKNEALEAMSAWLRARIKAVSDARSSVDYEGVQVYSAVEFNLVEKAEEGRATVLTKIIPRLEADLYSYSAWDSIYNPEKISVRLNFIKKYAPDSQAFGWKNVMIGEFGFPEGRGDKLVKIRLMLREFRRWGVPYCFYWQIYDNECDGERFHPADAASRETLKCRGFGLIDPLGRRTPAWQLLAGQLFSE
jgi:hypothetical protein